jgi:hypothetical protein
VIDLTPGRTLSRIAEVLAAKRYLSARATLLGIAATIQRTGRVTERQYDAVERIIAGSVKHDFAARAAGIRVRGER